MPQLRALENVNDIRKTQSTETDGHSPLLCRPLDMLHLFVEQKDAEAASSAWQTVCLRAERGVPLREVVVQLNGRTGSGCWQCKEAIRHTMVLDSSGRPTCMSLETAWRMAEEMAGAAKPLRLGEGSKWAGVEVKPGAAKKDEEEEDEEDEEEDDDE